MLSAYVNIVSNYIYTESCVKILQIDYFYFREYLHLV